jgi:SAM-dependent methyltransferase
VNDSIALPVSAAADRNMQPILDQLLKLLPAKGKVLEIASGTGQHVVHFAAALPCLLWQPSDPDPASIEVIAARRETAGLPNMLSPLQLDVLASWPVEKEFDAVLCINMIHISPWATTAALFAGAERSLGKAGSGLVVLYGPYRENGEHTSASNADFDHWLKSRDARWGVRDLEAVEASAATAGFARVHLARMPANNLLVAFKRH